MRGIRVHAWHAWHDLPVRRDGDEPLAVRRDAGADELLLLRVVVVGAEVEHVDLGVAGGRREAERERAADADVVEHEPFSEVTTRMTHTSRDDTSRDATSRDASRDASCDDACVFAARRDLSLRDLHPASEPPPPPPPPPPPRLLLLKYYAQPPGARGARDAWCAEEEGGGGGVRSEGSGREEHERAAVRDLDGTYDTYDMYDTYDTYEPRCEISIRWRRVAAALSWSKSALPVGDVVGWPLLPGSPSGCADGGGCGDARPSDTSTERALSPKPPPSPLVASSAGGSRWSFARTKLLRPRRNCASVAAAAAAVAAAAALLSAARSPLRSFDARRRTDICRSLLENVPCTLRCGGIASVESDLRVPPPSLRSTAPPPAPTLGKPPPPPPPPPPPRVRIESRFELSRSPSRAEKRAEFERSVITGGAPARGVACAPPPPP